MPLKGKRTKSIEKYITNDEPKSKRAKVTLKASTKVNEAKHTYEAEFKGSLKTVNAQKKIKGEIKGKGKGNNKGRKAKPKSKVESKARNKGDVNNLKKETDGKENMYNSINDSNNKITKTKGKAKTKAKTKVEGKAKAKMATNKDNLVDKDTDKSNATKGECRNSATKTKKKSGKVTKKGSTKATNERPATSKCAPTNRDNNRLVLVWGSGDMSQLGLGFDEQFREQKRPAVVKSIADTDIQAVSAGSLHNAALTCDGCVLTWGCNDEMALGRGEIDEGDTFFPGPVKGLDGIYIKQVVCGASHTAALSDDGDVYAWGTYRDLMGPLGFDEHTEKQMFPIVLTRLRGKKVASLVNGDNHDLVCTLNGEVWQWGDISLGRRTNDRNKKAKLAPTRVLFKSQKEGKHAKPKRIEAVYAGGSTSFAVDENGKAWAWGPNNYGQCGHPMDTKGQFIKVPTVVPLEGKVVRIAAAQYHSLFLTEDNKVWACGRGLSGRLGFGHELNIETPTVIPFFSQMVDDVVVDISCGQDHSFATTRNGKLYAWGYGDLLQLGTGLEKDVLTPVLIESQQLKDIPCHVLLARGGAQHSIALVQNFYGAKEAAPEIKNAAAETKDYGLDNEHELAAPNLGLSNNELPHWHLVISEPSSAQIVQQNVLVRLSESATLPSDDDE